MSENILKDGMFSLEIALSFRQSFRLLLTRLLPAYIVKNDLVQELEFNSTNLSEILSWVVLSMDRKRWLTINIEICSLDSVFKCSVFPHDEDHDKFLSHVSIEDGLAFFCKKIMDLPKREEAKAANP